MNGLFGPYIEKWMHFVTIKNMLLLAIGSVIITDLGLHLLRVIFPKSSFYESTLWQVIGPLDFTISDIISFLVGSIIMVLLLSGVLYVTFKVFKGTGTFKQLVADMLLTLCINSWIHLALALIIIPTTVLLNVSAQSNSYGLNYLEWINVIIMALLMTKQFNLSPWLTGIVYYFISFVITIIQLAFSGII